MIEKKKELLWIKIADMQYNLEKKYWIRSRNKLQGTKEEKEQF